MRVSTVVPGLLLALGLLAGPAAAQEKDKKAEMSEEERVRLEMNTEARRFVDAVKISARDAIAKAETGHAGAVVAVHPEDHPKLDKDGKPAKGKDGKDERVDCFEVVIVAEKAVFSILVDGDGKTIAMPAKDEGAREARDVVKRLLAVTAKVSILHAIEKVVAHTKGTVLAVLLDERAKKDGKDEPECWLVYVLEKDTAVYYRVDVLTGELTKRP